MPPKASKMEALIARKKKAKDAGAKAKASDQQDEQLKDQVDEVPAQQQEQAATADTAKVKKDESSDEEDDDAELNTGGAYLANIKEGKDVSNAHGEETKKNDPYGLEEKKEAAAGAGAKAKGPPRKTADQISFAGKPTFSRGQRGAKPQFAAADDFAGLDELDDEGNERKTKKHEKKATVAADDSKRDAEEEKSNHFESKKPVKPTFRGKLNLTKTGDGGEERDANKASSTNYGFTVKYKSDHPFPAGDKEDQKEGDKDGKPDTRRDRRNMNKDRGQPFGNFNKTKVNDGGFDDDGFQVVTDKTKIRRNRKNFKKNDSDSDDEKEGEEKTGWGAVDKGFSVNQRGGFRGRGRGGFERAGGERNAAE